MNTNGNMVHKAMSEYIPIGDHRWSRRRVTKMDTDLSNTVSIRATVQLSGA